VGERNFQGRKWRRNTFVALDDFRRKDGAAIIEPVILLTLGSTVSCKEILQISASSAQQMPIGQWVWQWYVIMSVVTVHLPACAFLPAFRCRRLQKVRQFLYCSESIQYDLLQANFFYYVITHDIDWSCSGKSTTVLAKLVFWQCVCLCTVASYFHCFLSLIFVETSVVSENDFNMVHRVQNAQFRTQLYQVPRKCLK